MSVFTVFIQAWTWLKKNFIDHIQSAAPVAIVITETIKTLLANPVASLLENIADTITGTQLPTNIANQITAIIPKILAVELGIEGLPPNPTPDQILAFEQAVLKAFNVNSNNSKLYTELAAQIYGIIQTAAATGVNNFATWVDAVEQMYAAYQKDLGANANIATANPILPAANQVSADQLAAEQSELKSAPAVGFTQTANVAQPDTVDPNAGKVG